MCVHVCYINICIHLPSLCLIGWILRETKYEITDLHVSLGKDYSWRWSQQWAVSHCFLNLEIDCLNARMGSVVFEATTKSTLMSLGCINLHNKFTHLWTAQRYWMVSFSEDIYITYGAMGYSLPVYLISKYSWYAFSSHFNTQFQISFYACPVGCGKYELCLPRMFHWVLSLSKQGSCLTTCSCYTFDSVSGFPLRPCSLGTFK